jgi:magnesium transporter
MLRSVLYRDGRVADAGNCDSIQTALEDSGSVLWVDMYAPDDSDYAVLRDDFRFHPLALEDAMREDQRAKVDQYAGYNLIVMFDLSLEPDSDQVKQKELTLFVGPNFVVTVHQEAIHSVDELWARLQQEPSIIAPHPLSLLVYQLADSLVDDYFPIVDLFDDRLADLEEQLFDSPGRVTLARLFTMRKSLIAMRRLTNQMRDVFNLLSRREQIVFNENTIPYYTDVYDHLLRVSDTLELQRDLLAGALETYLSIQSNELNLTVRKLTAVTVMIMIPTLIAGIYGMNFTHMPELQSDYGYPLALGVMVASSVGVYYYLKRRGWF